MNYLGDVIMKRKILKRTWGITKIVLIIIGISIAVLSILEIVIRFTKKPSEHESWYAEDQMINRMMEAKLSNKNWTTPESIWKYENVEYLPPKGNKKRVLVVGDSFVWGFGYTNPNMLWWQQLNTLFLENGYNNVEVVALGKNGLSTYMEYMNLNDDKIIEELDPDLILIGYVLNDPELDGEDSKPLVPLRISDEFPEPTNIFIKSFKKIWPNLYFKINDLIFQKYGDDEQFCEKYGYNYNDWLYKISSEPSLSEYEKRAVIPLKRTIEEKIGLKDWFFMTLDLFPDKNESDVSKEVLKLFEKHKIKTYNTIKNFADKFPEFSWDDVKEWQINPVDSHPGYKTARFYAEEAYKILTTDYPHIVGKKSEVISFPLEINDTTPYMLNAKYIGDNTYSLIYPKEGTTDAFLTLPMEMPYVKLNLKYPKKITKIEITGANIESIHLFADQINKELGYYVGEVKDLGKKEGSYVWEIEDEEITSVNISAKITNGKSSTMYIRFNY